MRYAKRLDVNHNLILNALRQDGEQVLDLSDIGGGIFDLLVLIHPGKSLALEVKAPDIKNPMAALTKKQVEYMRYMGKWTQVVQTVQQAKDAVTWARLTWPKD